MTPAFEAPFPYFGGKRLVAPIIWGRFGQPKSYVEPFAGSLAVLLSRPGWAPDVDWTETVNDLNGYVVNAWRAIAYDPEATAYWAAWPVFENDLHARHAWLTEQRDTLVPNLEGDPEFYDAKIAGWWLWGMACWIGGGFCSGEGPWVRQDGLLVRRGEEDSGVKRPAVGVQRRLPYLATPQGVHRRLPALDHPRGVQRRLPSLTAPRGVQRQLPYLAPRQGVQRRLPRGSRRELALIPWFEALAARLERVRICCGDWQRVLTPSACMGHYTGDIAVFLDPPYGVSDREVVYSTDDFAVAAQVREWCKTAPETWKIALCGYEGEHNELEERGWSKFAWQARGGMQRDKSLGGNRVRERIWFSPACEESPIQQLF